MRKLSPVERLDLILRGRKPYTWANSVALSRGAMHRLQKGHFPDPEKLVPACRVENISLSWWLDGIGPPYVVYIAATPHEHIVIAEAILTDEAQDTIVVAGNERAAHLVFITPAKATSVDGLEYEYRSVQIVGGSSADFAASQLIARHLGRYVMLKAVKLVDEKLLRLASGHMGAIELLDAVDKVTSDVIVDASMLHYQFPPPGAPIRISDDPNKGAMIEDILALSTEEADMVARMMRGLRRP